MDASRHHSHEFTTARHYHDTAPPSPRHHAATPLLRHTPTSLISPAALFRVAVVSSLLYVVWTSHRRFRLVGRRPRRWPATVQASAPCRAGISRFHSPREGVGIDFFLCVVNYVSRASAQVLGRAFLAQNPFFAQKTGFCGATPGFWFWCVPRGFNWRALELFSGGGGGMMSKTGNFRALAPCLHARPFPLNQRSPRQRRPPAGSLDREIRISAQSVG